MHGAIQVIQEGKRGCGYRDDKKGGLYLRGEAAGMHCGRMPIPLDICPTCGHGIRPARGWTWVEASALIEAAPPCETPMRCRYCMVHRMEAGEIEKAGLVWVGEQFYPTVDDFQNEAADKGICRRIAAVPHDFVLGETWVLLAHRKAIVVPPEVFGDELAFQAGIFRVFRPYAVEVICDGTEDDETIEGYLARGLTPVKVERIDEALQDELMETSEAA